MSRLKLSSCYLIGAMSECPNFGRDWRVVADAELTSRQIRVYNPVDKPTTYAFETPEFRDECYALIKQGDYEGVSELMRPVRRIDLRMCDKSDFGIYMLNAKRSWGSPEEVSLMNRQKKPVLCFCEDGYTIDQFGPWLFGQLPHRYFFASWEALLAYLDEVAYGPEPPDDPRWCFFQHERMFEKALGYETCR